MPTTWHCARIMHCGGIADLRVKAGGGDRGNVATEKGQVDKRDQDMGLAASECRFEPMDRGSAVVSGLSHQYLGQRNAQAVSGKGRLAEKQPGVADGAGAAR
jgi:hypothetical protein